MPLRNWAIAACVAVFIGGCATGFQAAYDHDASKDFGEYKYYAWISENPMKIGPSTRINNPLVEERVMEAVEQRLDAKGFQKVIEPRSADFVLSFTVGSREEIRVDSYPSMSASVGYGYPRHWGWGGMYYGVSTETSVRQYTQGMLAIDVFDVEERRPVWHGVAEKRISESDREDAVGTIQAAVDALLAGFPPP